MVALVDRIENVGDVRLDRSGVDAVGACCISPCLARRREVSSMARSIDPVILSALEDDLAVDICGRPADGLDHRDLGAQEAPLFRRREMPTSPHYGMSSPSRRV